MTDKEFMEQLRTNVIELDNGNYYYFEKVGDKLIAGTASNCGIFRDVVIDYDEDASIDENISRLYDKVVEYDNEIHLTECPRCGKTVHENDMYPTYDCHGIYFRHVCEECAEEVERIGYDGEYYTSLDENIWGEDY